MSEKILTDVTVMNEKILTDDSITIKHIKEKGTSIMHEKDEMKTTGEGECCAMY